MTKVRNKMQEIWNALSGRKTYIGVLVWLCTRIMSDVNWISDEQAQSWVTVAEAILGVGILHKISKKG